MQNPWRPLCSPRKPIRYGHLCPGGILSPPRIGTASIQARNASAIPDKYIGLDYLSSNESYDEQTHNHRRSPPALMPTATGCGRFDLRNQVINFLRARAGPKTKPRQSIEIAAAFTNLVAVESRCGAVALGSNISVPASFVWRCLTGSTMAPFPHPAHR